MINWENVSFWWVLGWDTYYPGVDNYLASFRTKEDAQDYILEHTQKQNRCDNYLVVDVSARLGLL